VYDLSIEAPLRELCEAKDVVDSAFRFAAADSDSSFSLAASASDSAFDSVAVRIRGR
jgi:hypothetical protein